VKTSAGSGVLGESIALVIIVARDGTIFLASLGEVVLVDKIIASVVRRVNVDHLNFSAIVVAQEFKDIKIVALDIEVLSRVEIDRFFTAGAQCCLDWRVRKEGRRPLARPVELVAFRTSLDDRTG
jgi:hypothetical protein